MPCQITMLPLATTSTSGSRSDVGTLRYSTEFYAKHRDSRYGTGKMIVLAGQGLRFEAPRSCRGRKIDVGALPCQWLAGLSVSSFYSWPPLVPSYLFVRAELNK